MTEQYETWQALDVRRPGDVPAVTPLAWQVEKLTQHTDRLMNNLLPDDFPHPVERGDADDALAGLALRESMALDLAYGRGSRIHEALRLGATWTQIAAALGTTTEQARQLLRDYADGQHRMYRRDVACGSSHLMGFSDKKHAEVVALCELADGQDPIAR